MLHVYDAAQKLSSRDEWAFALHKYRVWPAVAHFLPFFPPLLPPVWDLSSPSLLKLLSHDKSSSVRWLYTQRCRIPPEKAILSSPDYKGVKWFIYAAMQIKQGKGREGSKKIKKKKHPRALQLKACISVAAPSFLFYLFEYSVVENKA